MAKEYTSAEGSALAEVVNSGANHRIDPWMVTEVPSVAIPTSSKTFAISKSQTTALSYMSLFNRYDWHKRQGAHIYCD